MRNAIHRTEDPTLETIEFGAVYHTQPPYTSKGWTLYKIANNCGIDSIEPLDVPTGWDGAYEYAVADEHIWPRIVRLARNADLAHATLEVALVPVDEEMDTESCALLYRFSWPY